MSYDIWDKQVKYKRLDIDMGIGCMVGFVLAASFKSFVFALGPFFITIDWKK